MRYRLFISEHARQQLRALEKPIRRNIGYRIELMQDNLQGDVKKLEARANRYRLRVGSHSVLFTLEDSATADHAEPLTLEKVYRELQTLRARVEDLEDLRDLEEAIVQNAGKPPIPWEEVKRDLNLD